MAKNITYNGFDLQDENFRTKDIIYRNLPDKTIDLEPWARRDGFRLVNTYYSSKMISVSGTLTRDTEANLKTSLDSMKEALNTDEAELIIDDGSATFTYVCSVDSVRIPEEHYNITHIPYSISFLCQPFAKASSTSSNSQTITNTSSSPYVNTFNPTGSAPPLPQIKFTATGTPSSAITQITFCNSSSGETITISSLAIDASGDYIIVDVDDMSVKASYDGGDETEIDFAGVFPDFVSSTNTYQTTITGGGASWSLKQLITYYPLYL